jgi:SAM-dependent methyltransferase
MCEIDVADGRAPDHVCLMTNTIEIRESTKAAWTHAAAGWDRRFAWYARNFNPVMEWCIREAGVRSGSRVLDMACGSGLPAIVAARQAGEEGRVVGIDIAPAMLEVAKRRAGEAGVTNMEFVEMDADRLRFPDSSFDAVTCAYALMFCPDALQVLREIRRVLRPGGRFAVVVWDEPAKSPFLTVGAGTVAHFFPMPAPSPDSPHPFRFADPSSLDALLRAAGVSSHRIESVPMSIVTQSPGEYWEMFLDMAGAAGAKVATLPRAERDRAAAMAAERLLPFTASAGVTLVATSLCASGTR